MWYFMSESDQNCFVHVFYRTGKLYNCYPDTTLCVQHMDTWLLTLTKIIRWCRKMLPLCKTYYTINEFALHYVLVPSFRIAACNDKVELLTCSFNNVSFVWVQTETVSPSKLLSLCPHASRQLMKFAHKKCQASLDLSTKNLVVFHYFLQWPRASFCLQLWTNWKHSSWAAAAWACWNVVSSHVSARKEFESTEFWSAMFLLCNVFFDRKPQVCCKEDASKKFQPHCFHLMRCFLLCKTTPTTLSALTYLVWAWKWVQFLLQQPVSSKLFQCSENDWSLLFQLQSCSCNACIEIETSSFGG